MTKQTGLNSRLRRLARATLVIFLFATGLLAITPPSRSQQAATVAGNHPPDVERMALTEVAPADQILTMRLYLSLSHRDELNRLLAAQQNPASKEYRNWLKPGEFDRRFAPDPQVRESVVKWLSASGFVIDQAGSGTREIRFHGTIAQAERAFGVAIRTSDGGAHFANLEDPSVPAQFADAITFIDGLDNMRAAVKERYIVPGSEADESAPHELAAESTGFTPQDFYEFYDANALMTAGVTGSGAGCIALAEVSDYSSAGVARFDSTFKLATANLTRVFPDGTDPGTNDREDETMLDILWSHSMGPGAPISVYIGDPAAHSGNLIDATVAAIGQAVTDNTCSTISVSIESCGFPSTYYTGTGAGMLNTILTKAQTQGQTVFIAEGDEGAAEYQYDSSTNECVIGTTRNVNELASNPLVIAVGGTQFTPEIKDGVDVGFVPESVWNETGDPPGIGAGGGGASVVFAKPSFQDAGTPADGARDVPDVSIEAACHTPGAYSVFPDQKSGTKPVCCGCGTSIGAPMWSGITELLVQGNGGQRVGTLNPTLYQLGGERNAAATGIRDVTMGNNDYNGVTGFDAVPGYDQASGWGTPDITNFVNSYLIASGASPVPIPPATLKVTPPSLNFQKLTVVNATSKAKSVIIKNTSSTKSGLTAMIGTATTDNPVFTVSQQCTPSTLTAGQSCKIDVTFTPFSTTPAAGHLKVPTDATNGELSIPLEGTGKAPK